MFKEPEKLRVVFLPDYSGGNPYQRLLAKALARYGVTVEFWSGKLHPMKIARGKEIIHLHWWEPYLFANSRIKALVNAIYLLVVTLTWRLLSRRVVWTVHNLRSHESRAPLAERTIVKGLTRTVSSLIFHCQNAKDLFVEEYGQASVVEKKASVIPHGHFVSYYEHSLDRESPRNQLGLDSSDLVFLYFGVIRRYKDLGTLVDAFKDVQIASARLLIRGRLWSQDMLDDYTTLVEGDPRINARFGFVPDEEVDVLLNAADAVILPFRSILTSSSLILAMSYSKALIVPPIGCIPETIHPDGCLFFEPGDSGSLRRALEKAATLNLFEMGKRNRDRVTEFDWIESARLTLDVYNH
jgi:beta-1,4-mannosyltransferase